MQVQSVGELVLANKCIGVKERGERLGNGLVDAKDCCRVITAGAPRAVPLAGGHNLSPQLVALPIRGERTEKNTGKNANRAETAASSYLAMSEACQLIVLRRVSVKTCECFDSWVVRLSARLFTSCKHLLKLDFLLSEILFLKTSMLDLKYF